MTDAGSLAPDAPAIILLCSSVGAPSGSVRPFGPAAWADLADRVAQASLGGPRDLVGLAPDQIVRSIDISVDEADRIARLLTRSGQLAFELDRLQSRGVWVVTIADDTYPARLRDRLGSGAPPVLFGSGPASLLADGGVAIVGSREADESALAFTARLAAAVVAGGSAVVSGGARGIDVTSMGAAFKAGGVVIGVLPEGVERRLREPSTRAAVAGGQAVVVSPYHPSAAFSVGAAMGRNKLIYALSDVAVVVSSADGSGGTWTGAVEALKGGWVSVLVRDDSDAPSGNRSLIALGAAPLPVDAIGPAIRASDLIAIAGPVGRTLADPAHAHSQPTLFDEVEP
jgi:predicted Rossmann fold nucleotide-binding protein DprA/Smf involved in DNA uptake